MAAIGAAAIGRRRLVHGMAAGAAMLLLPRRVRAQAADAARAAMAAAATAYLAALPADARRRTVFAFEEKERFDWHYVPRSRAGLALKDMPTGARAAAHALMKTSLSAAGYDKAAGIIQLEDVLRRLETFGGLLRNPENYAISVFGTPGPSGAWGWRIEGHHLSLNFTVVPGKPIGATPAFMGANPAAVPSGARKGLRTLAREQDLGRALAQSADAAQRGRMIIGDRSLGDIVTGPGREQSLASPAGLELAEMTEEQRGIAIRLVEEYVLNMRAEVAQDELRRMREAGVDRIRFAWAGSLEAGKAHYYRVHGPTLLIEYDNTQNDANHVHSVWHDPRGDFGLDALRAHYATGHHG